MAIFEVTSEGVVKINTTTFANEQLHERRDIQRLLREKIDCIEEGLLVLAEEFSDWRDSSRRIDLLCLDRTANLVVMELKRDEDGGHMELQALRYAAMVSTMTLDQAVDTLAQHRNRSAPDAEQAREVLFSFLGWDEANEDRFAQDTRIILVAADFGKEVTTSVIWLRDRGIDIKCVRMKPYRLDNGRLLMDIQQLIPLPEAADFQTQLGVKRMGERKDRAERQELRYRFWEMLLARARQQTDIHAGRAPNEGSWVSGSTGRTGFHFNYVTRKTDSHVELWIASDKEAFEALRAERQSVETEFGAPLGWEELPGKRGAAVRFQVNGGYRSPPEDWPRIHDELIAAMIALNRAFRSRLHALRHGATHFNQLSGGAEPQ